MSFRVHVTTAPSLFMQVDWSEYKKEERRFRCLGKGADAAPASLWADIVDFAHPENCSDELRSRMQTVAPSAACPLGFNPAEARIHAIRGVDGFRFIPRPFSDAEHLRWVAACCRDFSAPPYAVTNLQVRGLGRARSSPRSRARPVTNHARARLHVCAQSDAQLWRNYLEAHRECTRHIDGGDCSASRARAGAAEARRGEEPLNLCHARWATLGWHYDWTTRCYREDHLSPFPRDLALLAREIGAYVGMPIAGQAGIVNFYNAGDSVMGGHRDDLELAFSRPVVSMSFGCTAIFLLGGASKSVKPIAICVRSGDVLAMGGRSRLAFHGVAAVIPATIPACLRLAVPARGPSIAAADEGVGDPAALRALACYLGAGRGRRINVNVRQVLEAGCVFPVGGVTAARLSLDPSAADLDAIGCLAFGDAP